MCLKVKTRLPIQKGIICYKVLLKSDTRYTSPFSPMRWYQGITETAEPKELKAGPDVKEINGGYFHAYTTYRRAARAACRMGMQVWDLSSFVVCKMMIPPIAGEVFYGTNQDVCAKRMKFIKEIVPKGNKKKK